ERLGVSPTHQGGRRGGEECFPDGWKPGGGRQNSMGIRSRQNSCRRGRQTVIERRPRTLGAVGPAIGIEAQDAPRGRRPHDAIRVIKIVERADRTASVQDGDAGRTNQKREREGEEGKKNDPSTFGQRLRVARGCHGALRISARLATSIRSSPPRSCPCCSRRPSSFPARGARAW